MADLRGDVILVTGGSRGIGRAIALDLARAGAEVVIQYRIRRAEALAVVQAIEAAGGRAIAVEADVSDRAAVEAMAERAGRWRGRLDGVVTAAGVYRGDATRSVSPDAWTEPLRVDLDGTFWTVRSTLPWLAGSAHPAIVTVSSVLGAHAAAGGAAYQAAKAGVEQITRALALELAPRVRVNAVAPGFVRTDMNRAGHEDPEFHRTVRSATPLGRWGEPDDIAPAVRFLLSRDADWITGIVLGIDGGIALR